MVKITRDDIQHINDEDTLIRFLEEKLNLPIPEEVTLAQIAVPLPLPFLELAESIAEQIIDCQDFRGLPEDALDERAPFLVRFRYESGYPDILREIAEGLYQKNINPAGIFFICANKNFQPFAIAYFSGSSLEDWHTAELTILAWMPENTHVYTSSEHELSIDFFANEPSENSDDESDNVDEPLDVFDDKLTISTVDSTSPEALLVKLKSIGASLQDWKIHKGVDTGYSKAYIIDVSEQLVDVEPESSNLIKPYILKPRKKWKAESKNIIWIPSSQNNKWPWSGASSEAEAERIFEDIYPKIKTHLYGYKDRLQKRLPTTQGEFYWEVAMQERYLEIQHPKIVYPMDDKSMSACYDTSGALHLSNSFFIHTSDLSLLAILNSAVFDWYAKGNCRAQFKSKVPKNWLSFKKSNMRVFPVANRTEEQKAELSDLVQRILNDSDSPEVSDIEWEIDQLVYKLYELTPAEIALIEKGRNQ